MLKKLIIASSILALTGCAPVEEEAQLEKGTPIQKVEVKESTKGQYQVGDKIISMAIDGNTNNYSFGGFLDEDTFVINIEKIGVHVSPSNSYYYTIKRDMQFELPDSSTIVKLKDFSISEGTITLEK